MLLKATAIAIIDKIFCPLEAISGSIGFLLISIYSLIVKVVIIEIIKVKKIKIDNEIPKIFFL